MDDINSNISNHNNHNKEQILLPSIKKPKPDTVQSEQRQMMATTATNAITTTTTTMTYNHNNPHYRQQLQQQQPQQQHSDYAADAKSKYPGKYCTPIRNIDTNVCFLISMFLSLSR